MVLENNNIGDISIDSEYEPVISDTRVSTQSKVHYLTPRARQISRNNQLVQRRRFLNTRKKHTKKNKRTK